MLYTDLIVAGAREFHMKPSQILSRSRGEFVTRARFTIYKAFRMRGLSYPQIGRAMGKHHSTVMHGVRRAEEIMAQEPAYAQRIERIANFDKSVEGATE